MPNNKNEITKESKELTARTNPKRSDLEKRILEKKAEYVFETVYEIEGGAIKHNHKNEKDHTLANFEATGISNASLATVLMLQLANLESAESKKDAGHSLTAALAFIKSQRPKDEMEVLLLAQQYAAHHLAMKFAHRASTTNDMEVATANTGRSLRAMKMYGEHLEALNKHRGKGQQKVTVEHVHVHEGGQAIVGNIEHGGGANGKPKR